MVTHEIPDGLPVLSRGKHRSPRKGACFMEMASVLANEKWSDHPGCTHPVLAHLARLVNDHTSDQNRGELAPLIPSVVGLRGGGLPWTVGLTAAVALHALPDVPASSQRALVAGLVRCDEAAVRLGPGAVHGEDAIRRALRDNASAVAWARRFSSGAPLNEKTFERRSAPSVMQCAVGGLVAASVYDSDARLRELLQVGIATGLRLQPRPAPAPTEAAPNRVQTS